MSSKIVTKQWCLCQICRPSMWPSNTYLATKLIPVFPNTPQYKIHKKFNSRNFWWVQYNYHKATSFFLFLQIKHKICLIATKLDMQVQMNVLFMVEYLGKKPSSSSALLLHDTKLVQYWVALRHYTHYICNQHQQEAFFLSKKFWCSASHVRLFSWVFFCLKLTTTVFTHNNEKCKGHLCLKLSAAEKGHIDYTCMCHIQLTDGKAHLCRFDSVVVIVIE